MTIDTLSLDVGGVLAYPNWVRASEALGRHGIPVEAAALAAAEPRAKRALDVAREIAATTDADRWMRYFELVLAHAGVEVSEGARAAFEELRAYHARVNLWETVPRDVVPALERFRAAGLKRVVVSNANGTLRVALERIGLAPYFDAIVDSAEEGIEKPAARIFHIGLGRVGARPEAALHVGDLYQVDVVGARSAGMAAVLLDPAGLYAGYDCERVATLAELADRIDGLV